MTARASTTRRFVAGSGIALLLLGPVTAVYGTCDERAEKRAEDYARRADHVVEHCLRRVARYGGACLDARAEARLERLRARLVRVHGWRCPTASLEARVAALTERIFCHRLERCGARFGSMRLAVVASGAGAERTAGASRRLAVDSGWTGIAHDLAILEGAGFVSELASCGVGGDGRCELFGRTAGTPFGAPSPISAGGVPVCVTVDFASDVVGHVDLARGDLVESATVAISVFADGGPERPCPVCVSNGAPAIGAAGTCEGGANHGGVCVVGGLAGPEWGDRRGTSRDCLPRAAPLARFTSVVTATTGAVARTATLPCEAAQSGHCWCPEQWRPNACVDGACTPTRSGGACAYGPFESRCERASGVYCASNGDCPPGDRCADVTPRGCFPDPIVLRGTPAPPVDGVALPTLVGVFCMANAHSAAVNAAAGYPGPTAFVWPAEVTFAE